VQRTGAPCPYGDFLTQATTESQSTQKFHRAYREEVSQKEVEDYQIFRTLTIIILT